MIQKRVNLWFRLWLAVSTAAEFFPDASRVAWTVVHLVQSREETLSSSCTNKHPVCRT